MPKVMPWSSIHAPNPQMSPSGVKQIVFPSVDAVRLISPVLVAAAFVVAGLRARGAVPRRVGLPDGRADAGSDARAATATAKHRMREPPISREVALRAAHCP